VDQVVPSRWPILSYESFSADYYISILGNVPGQLNFDYRETSGQDKDHCENPEAYGYNTIENPRSGQSIKLRSSFSYQHWRYNKFTVQLCLRRNQYDFGCSNDNPTIYFQAYLELIIDPSHTKN
jgi:hypothetical protein